MDAIRVFEELLNQTSNNEDRELCFLFRQHLEKQDYLVAKDNDELRDLALTNTDLVEPE